MTWVPDSRQAGYLGPDTSPQPSHDVSWEDFLHDIIAGITGLDPTLVRPRWQPEPPDMPDLGVNWVAFGVTESQVDFEPWVGHNDAGNGGLGQDILQEHQVDTVMCSFYGPHAGRYASYLRRGFYIEQNRAVLRANAAGLVEVTALNRSPEYIRNQWLDRVDTNVIIRREIRFNYDVCTLIQATGLITANPPFNSTRILTTDFDTDEILHPEEY